MVDEVDMMSIASMLNEILGHSVFIASFDLDTWRQMGMKLAAGDQLTEEESATVVTAWQQLHGQYPPNMGEM